MSNLLANGDDFPEAAEKLLADAKALHNASRYDGAAYMAGYVAECSLKTILLIELLARETRATTVTQLALVLSTPGAWAAKLPDFVKVLRYKIGHDVQKALRVATGKSSELHLHACGAVSNRYVRGVRATLGVLRWDPFHRYQAPGRVKAAHATRRVRGAEQILKTSVRTMRNDGVVL